MTATSMRHLLFEYIRFADQKKIKAFYTIVEDEIQQSHEIWTKSFEKEMLKRDRDLTNGKNSKSWTEVQKKAKAILNKK